MKRVLVTGCAGFIGSHFVDHFLVQNPESVVIGLDAFTYAADPENLKPAKELGRFSLQVGSITENYFLRMVFEQFGPFDAVVHFAAESHVDNSLANPGNFINTNIVGTYRLLETVRTVCPKARFLHVSTDEVYGQLRSAFDSPFTEGTPCAPRSPYSASKAASDMLALAYASSFGLDVVVSRCSNNYGPRQHAEKFIPTVIRKALAGEKIPVYGTGTNIRDWLFVTDHVRALEMLLRARPGVYNIGGGVELRNIDLAETICRCIGADSSIIELVEDRKGHDFRYAVNASKLTAETGWLPEMDFPGGLWYTVEWYKEKWRREK